MTPRSLLLAAALVAMLGCVRPPREDPRVRPIRGEDLGLSARAGTSADSRWWRAFGDEQLDALVEESLSRNPSLDQALARVRAAQAMGIDAVGARKPRIALNGEELRQRFAQTYYYPPPYAGNDYWTGQITANLDWSLDFWGRQAALIRQAGANLSAAQLDRGAANLALSGIIVQAYADLYRAYALEDIATQAEDQRRQLFALTRQRTAAGLDTRVEEKNAQADVPQAQAARWQAHGDRELAIHRLAALTGRGADAYAAIRQPHLALTAALPLPEALPMDLLSRRPDVLAARARVDAATAGRQAAEAAFYPNLSLGAFAGLQSIGLSTLLQSGSRVYGVGPAINLPIFDSARLRARYRDVSASLDSAVAAYNEIILDAVRQTADQISVADSLTRRVDLAEQSLGAAETAHRLAERRYAAGLGNRLAVLNAESRTLSANRDLIALRADLLAARVNLLVAVGGGFNPGARP